MKVKRRIATASRPACRHLIARLTIALVGLTIAFVGLTIFFVLAGCTDRDRPAPDSPHSTLHSPQSTLHSPQSIEDSVCHLYGTDPDRALQVLDSAELRGRIRPLQANVLRAIVYSHSNQSSQQDSAILLCEQLLLNDSLTAETPSAHKNRRAVLEQLCTVFRTKRNYELWLYWATQLADLESKMDMEVEVLRTKADIGLILSHLGHTDEALSRLDRIIGQLDRPGSVDRMDASIITLKRKINILMDADRPAEVVTAARRIIAIIDAYQAHPTHYAEDSFRLPPETTDRARYCNYYRAQAYAYLAQAHARMGEKEESLRYCDLFAHTPLGQTFGGQAMLDETWLNLGQYDRMEAIYEQEEQNLGSDTLCPDYATILHNRALAEEGRGHLAEACQYWHRYNRLSNRLNDSLQASHVHDYAARYHAQQQQLEIERTRADAFRGWSLALAALLAALFASVLALYAFWQRRLASRQNLALGRMIDELLKTAGGPAPEEQEEQPHPAPACEEEEKLPPPPGRNEAELFLSIDRRIRDERLYANPNFQRYDAMALFGISRTTLSQLLNTYAGGQSFPTYINNIRMEKACALLRAHPTKTISAIADEVGLSQHNFHRLFRRYFGQTPLTYQLRHCEHSAR